MNSTRLLHTSKSFQGKVNSHAGVASQLAEAASDPEIFSGESECAHSQEVASDSQPVPHEKSQPSLAIAAQNGFNTYSRCFRGRNKARETGYDPSTFPCFCSKSIYPIYYRTIIITSREIFPICINPWIIESLSRSHTKSI